MKTLEELNALPDDELRLMLAELDGRNNLVTSCWRSNKGGIETAVPNYTQDLNACADVEKTLEYAEEWYGEEHHANACEAYMGWVQQVSGKDDWDFLTATARQRTIALIFTLQPQ